MKKLNVKKYIEYFHLTNKFEFNLYEVLSLLVYARVVNPCSKYRTYYDALPYLNESYDFSYEQSLTGLGFLGDTYEKIVEIFTVQVDKVFKLDTKKTYFDCTNFYFEIDRKDPRIGMGLLLDKNQIPIGMKLFPGNESEKPIMREVIDKLKKQNNIVGRTIHVADKGLNCSKNIAFSKLNKDGYIFLSIATNLDH